MYEKVEIWNYASNYMWTEENDTIYFRTLRDRIDIAWFDKRTKMLYENTKYKNRFINATSEIHKTYNLSKDQISEYIDMI